MTERQVGSVTILDFAGTITIDEDADRLKDRIAETRMRGSWCVWAPAASGDFHLVTSAAFSGVQSLEMWNRLLAGESYRGTLVNRKKTGELYWANQTITPITHRTGHITHFVTVLKDVTQARKYHEQEVRLRLARAVQQRFNSMPPNLSGFDIVRRQLSGRRDRWGLFRFHRSAQRWVVHGDRRRERPWI
jgi:hypothetical protein